MTAYVHPVLHTEYSLIDSTIRIKALIDRAVALGMPAVAMTDQCNLFGLVKFFRAAEKAGVKPIAGADLLVTEEGEDEPYRLIVLCQDHRGYLSLSRLLSMAYRHRQLKSTPTVDAAWVEQHSDGLIALAGLADGQPGRHLLGGRVEAARHSLARWMGVFADRYYVDIARVGREHEDRYNDGVIVLAAEAGCPVVASNDVRFLARDDFDAHEARVCIATGRVLADPRRPRHYTPEQYLKSPEEMAAVFADLPGALDNAVELATRCNLELRLGTYFLPEFPLPAGETVESHLTSESRRGLARRLEKLGCAPGIAPEDYQSRLDHELGVIIQMGFPGYFLIVADFIRWAKENGIPVGPGRGSGAGSLVAWSLGITDLDPLRYDLLFERFLNPERVSMPDFDVDFCMDQRDAVIDYTAQRYGRDKVCQIITYGSMNAKAVIRDVGRVLGHPYGYVDSIAKLIPNTLGIRLSEALAESPELKERVDSEEDVGELFELALKLEGLTRNAGKHAGGVVIAPGPLTDFSPLYCEPGGEGVVTQFDKDDVESIGLVKFDFLGLRTLTIIDWAVKSINLKRQAAGEPLLDMDTLPMDDEASFRLLQSTKTTAVFQLESRGMKDLIGRLKPESFDDIVALVALYRPGPLDSGMVDTYVDCKHGRRQVRYPHPKLEPILKPTYGVILYQEQVMQIAQVLAGYTLGGADILRRAMGKKKPEEMAKQRQIFVTGATEHGIEAQLAESIFDLMEKFAGYGFNKSHSAAYALLAYQTAWLKAHYPADFMAAVMSSDMDNTDKVVNFIDDARGLGLALQPPDVNVSRYQFTASDDHTVVYGLGAIKGVGQAAIEALTDERDANGSFSNLHDFCRRIDLGKANKRVLEALILAGALDALGPNRATMMQQLPDVMRAAEQESRDRAAGQVSLFGAPAPASPATQEGATIPEWPELERLAGERNTLGLYLTGHPIKPWLPDLEKIITTRLGSVGEVWRPPPGGGMDRGRPRGTPMILAGLILSVRKRDNAAFFALDDQTGRMEVAAFREAFETSRDWLASDQIVVVEGEVSPDEYTGGYSMRATRILPGEQAIGEFARGLKLKLRNGVDLADLQSALAAHRGEATVWVGYANARACATIRLGDGWQVRVSRSLIEQLQQVAGIEEASALFPRDLS